MVLTMIGSRGVHEGPDSKPFICISTSTTNSGPHPKSCEAAAFSVEQKYLGFSFWDLADWVLHEALQWFEPIIGTMIERHVGHQNMVGPVSMTRQGSTTIM
ncbi:hypothetical protein HYALB_00007572 [Hymenoscyphus albidus]|uniref:Uncharacterized protein n=1 Tax=Hymenoscyphus albidus TaxID=595503 RepID=A0A9N9PYR9_9HELO|nr:hypothetical protein HYALB_00007572 [Hymenoscyphus albidus]